MSSDNIAIGRHEKSMPDFYPAIGNPPGKFLRAVISCIGF